MKTLVHETWGDHTVLVARSEASEVGSVGIVSSKVVDVATFQRPLELVLGNHLDHVAVTYETYGQLNAKGTNAILICHALTGSAHAAGRHESQQLPGWWDPLVGPGKALDTNHYYVISSNVLGGCYGTTGPSSINPSTGKPYGLEFPRYTIRDMVEVQARLVKHLGVTSLATVIGGSMGAMQVLEWAVMYPELVRSIIPIASGSRHSAWAIGLNEVARRAITADPTWQGGNYQLASQPESGLGLARAIAMLSYRSFDSLEAKFGRERVSASRELLDVGFEIESYLAYQGVKLVERFDANTYLYITRAMDDFDLSEGRGRLGDVLEGVNIPTLVMGISSDVLYPENEQKGLVDALPQADYARINSPHGHDAFLIEFPQIAVHVRSFLERAK
ncbi:MAG: homoserine O-acetyltransferase [Trueperaceae bacterium]|jgi:homoserine O-acetyltransferase|nr:homoserine O-acetyltransferase [Trueperaceae bacterium]|tara:strand:- start:9090 stop:10259 length:1170 start_codon:yes stop_codon:yes gene_type:complete